MWEKLLESSIDLAIKHHKGQVDKGGNPYIQHCLEVMEGLSTIQEKNVGVLHDAIEDTDLTFNKLRELNYPSIIIEALDSVTRREGETRDQFIYRCSQNRIGKKVKMVDLGCNVNLSRLPNPTAKDFQRNQMYKRDILIFTGDNWRFNGKKFKQKNMR
ncbi:GTP pyrophosphokinase [Priestia filamentosa]|uniref:GTP pyrophosphokinase n=1 Tax=Priestia filamentosa TaxID=1402861 RepID=UPI003982C80F